MKDLLFKVFLILFVPVILFLCAASMIKEYGQGVSDMQSECRWTDSAYLSVVNGMASVNKDAPLFQWPMGHDVRIYADQNGKLFITYYPTLIHYEI